MRKRTSVSFRWGLSICFVRAAYRREYSRQKQTDHTLFLSRARGSLLASTLLPPFGDLVFHGLVGRPKSRPESFERCYTRHYESILAVFDRSTKMCACRDEAAFAVGWSSIFPTQSGGSADCLCPQELTLLCVIQLKKKTQPHTPACTRLFSREASGKPTRDVTTNHFDASRLAKMSDLVRRNGELQHAGTRSTIETFTYEPTEVDAAHHWCCCKSHVFRNGDTVIVPTVCGQGFDWTTDSHQRTPEDWLRPYKCTYSHSSYRSLTWK